MRKKKYIGRRYKNHALHYQAMLKERRQQRCKANPLPEVEPEQVRIYKAIYL
jgi:hypothetical protein